jgi:hypothetical protein
MRRREMERKEAIAREEEFERRRIAEQAQDEEDEREQEMHRMWNEHNAELESQRRYNEELEQLSIEELQEKLGVMCAGEDDIENELGNEGEGSVVSSIGMEQDETGYSDQHNTVVVITSKRKTDKPQKSRNSRIHEGDNEDTSESSAGDRSNVSEWNQAKLVKKKKDDHAHRSLMQMQSYDDTTPCHLTDITSDGIAEHGRAMLDDSTRGTTTTFDMRKWAQQGRRRNDKKSNTNQVFILPETIQVQTTNPFDPLRSDQEEKDEGDRGDRSPQAEQE